MTELNAILKSMLPVVTMMVALSAGAPSKVTLEQVESKFRLVVDGKPFDLRGAGGGAPKALLKKAGGNAFRTWGVGDDTPGILDEAAELGLKVVLGIWLEHQRHGFDYTDAKKVQEQFEVAKAAVLRYRDHPALLAWGVGNEMEGFEEGGDRDVWKAVNDIAQMIKELDPNHPTMTVVAEIGGARVKAIHEWCPAIDIVGVNSYGGVLSLGERYREAGGKKPFIVSEYGPAGAWEQPSNAWDVPVEKTSTEKAAVYRAAYDKLSADPMCVGTFAFTWGFKQEATANWFGLFLPDLTRLGAVDELAEAWTGRAPANRSPAIESLTLTTPGEVGPAERVKVALKATDPEGDPIVAQWVLRKEMVDFVTGGDHRPTPPMYRGAVESGDHRGATIRMPTRPGRYRLYVYVRDGQGGGAAANVPLRVRGDEAPTAWGEYMDLPLVLYGDDRVQQLYAPSGYMGDHEAIDMDLKWNDRPRAGATCIKAVYRNAGGWGGVVWQNPPNDWGNVAGGFRLHGAQRLIFWARGEQGGERVKFGFGLLGKDKTFADSAGEELEVVLDADWKRYAFDLTGKNLDRIKSGFYWVVGGQGRAVTFFLDDIRYE